MTDEQRVVANKLAKQREYFTHLAPIGETNKTKTICFDLETTGVNNELDEVLEITILDGNFNICKTNFHDFLEKRRSCTSYFLWYGKKQTNITTISTPY